MPFAIKGELVGLDRLARRLNGMKRGLRNSILRRAITKAVRPLAKHAKFLAPTRSGMLRRSIGFRVVVNKKTGVVIGLVGPRTGFRKTKQGRQATALGNKIKATGINPTRYAHLVELGTTHSEPKPFLRPAWEEGKDQAAATIAEVIREGLEKAS